MATSTTATQHALRFAGGLQQEFNGINPPGVPDGMIHTLEEGSSLYLRESPGSLIFRRLAPEGSSPHIELTTSWDRGYEKRILFFLDRHLLPGLDRFDQALWGSNPHWLSHYAHLNLGIAEEEMNNAERGLVTALYDYRVKGAPLFDQMEGLVLQDSSLNPSHLSFNPERSLDITGFPNSLHFLDEASKGVEGAIPVFSREGNLAQDLVRMDSELIMAHGKARIALDRLIEAILEKAKSIKGDQRVLELIGNVEKYKNPIIGLLIAAGISGAIALGKLAYSDEKASDVVECFVHDTIDGALPFRISLLLNGAESVFS